MDGYFTVLPGHLPMLAALRGGMLRFQQEHQTKVVAIGPGFVEAGAEGVRLLTDAYATPEKIKPEELAKEQAEINEKMKAFADDPTGVEFRELTRAYEWCEARLETHRVANL